MATAIPVLMYHELARASVPLCRTDEGYTRYCVPETTFRAHLAWLRAQGLQGWSLTQGLAHIGDAARGVAITFDDGCATDLDVAAPLLREAGFSATVFVVSTWVGKPGFLSAVDLRALHDSGVEIGAHSRTHAYLPDLPPTELRAEIAGAKEELEQRLGASVDHFSCPGGRWIPEVAAVAREAGFRTVSTSRPGVITAKSDRLRLPRTAITVDQPVHEFARICRGERRWLHHVRHDLLSGAKQLLGSALYERVRGAVLGRGT